MKTTEEQQNVWQAEADLYTEIDRLSELAQCYGVHDQLTLTARENLLRAIDIYGQVIETNVTRKWLTKYERASA